jgi:hypothetical protein
MIRSKTIQIFLKDSDPNGIKIAELSVSTAKVYVIPRNQISFITTRQDLNSPALYMLFDDERTSVYIGECENFIHRIRSHEVNKSFWQWAVVVVSSNASLDKADVKFLESYAVMKAIEVGRFEVQNRTNPNKNNLHEFKQETVLNFFDDVELLISTLGFNLFEPLKLDIIDDQKSIKNDTTVSNNIREYDTIVCPSTGEGLEKAFIEKNAWWAVRIGHSNIKKLKYIALYEAAPISSIRYYAKITKIEPYEDMPGKYIIHHDGNIIKLENSIILGKVHQLALFGPRYYKLEDILNSKTLAELTNIAYGSSY